jgi:AcrR family transcriptional regulator
MPRQTSEQLRAEVIDAAAALFARQGSAHTALQQIADAVKYSKAGLLHHFPSKNAVYDAVVETAIAQVALLTSGIAAVPVGVERDRVVVQLSVDMTYRWPGLAAFCLALSDHDDFQDPRLLEAGASLAQAWGVDETADDDRIVRVVTASAGLTASAITAVRADRQREWSGAIQRAAMNALGHVDDAD